MNVALRHKKCSFRIWTFRAPFSVFPLKIRELMSLLILTCQQFALLVRENHECGHMMWEEKETPSGVSKTYR